MSENLFEKLNKQSETIDQVAEKLDGVSITDLYALAKRTWDYRDYEMAQKYYNHISLLSPLEWEAPFRASLCGCLSEEPVVFWDRRPKRLLSIINLQLNIYMAEIYRKREKYKRLFMRRKF